jgi:molecular chaperone DnaK (HSP70)
VSDGRQRRYVVGIDLGTTNSAVAWVDTAERAPRVRIFDVTQLVAPGEVKPRSGLPSFLYLAGEHDLPPAATRLPWGEPPAVGEARVVVGELARTQGARVPGRMVASAKSWLSHAGVDRQAAILPWGAAEGPKISPVVTEAEILAQVARAFEQTTGVPIDAAEVIVTVPASFDEVARELTVQAATKARLGEVTLLEEPQAAFYDWIEAHDTKARRAALGPRERVLVCDVGGGTTDFTIIDVDEEGDGFARSAVGDHLLLGGDNMDIALARRVEGRVGKVDAVQWHGLVHACRLAKEQMLEDPTLESRVITVAARGASVIRGTRKDELTRAELMELVVEGFFPPVPRDARPERARTGLHEFGLPYAADAAITRHLAAFLARHHVTRVDAVLFNGGAMKPQAVRERVLGVLAGWQQGTPPPRELVNRSPELAVARGAAYYDLVRRGLGTRIRGGAARGYYVGLDAGQAICVLERGAEEGSERELEQDFTLVMNRPVSFRLYSESARADRPGELVANAAETLAELPPLVTVLRAPGRRETRVRVRTRLTEIGTLEIWCQEPAGERWRLSFDLRGTQPVLGGGPGHVATEADEEDEGGPAAPELPALAAEARALLRAAFEGAPGAPDPAGIVKELERVLDARRDEWPTALIRALWDTLYEVERARARSPEIEGRWLNLAGYLLRPGHGAALDDWRITCMWKVFNAGLEHDRDNACRLAWWILWRRLAGGLKRGHQEQVHGRIAPLFLPGEKQKAKWYKVKPTPQEAAEMWRAVASLERLPAAWKVTLGDELIARLEKRKDTDSGFWALGRLGARVPLYGPLDAVVPAEAAARWIDRLLALAWAPPEKIAFPAAQMGRRTGDRVRDLDDAVRGRLAERLRAMPGGERPARLVEEVVALEAREERVAFGDTLPAGLRMVPPAAAEPE